MARVLITGISRFLGAALATALEAVDEIEHIVGVGTEPPPVPLERTEFVRADIRSPLIQKVLSSSEVDTVVHADLTSRAVRVGGRASQKERNVIGTMQLLGACQRIEGVRKVVVRSSTAVYGSEPGDPSVLTEDWSGRSSSKGGYSQDVVDAETYARDFGRRRPDVTLTILRMGNIVGPMASTNMTELFSLPLVPTAWGFDPRLQLLHEHDAVEVLKQSVLGEHPGVFNVAGDGVLYLSQAIRRAGRLPLPIALPVGQTVGNLLRSLRLVDFPIDQISLMIHGRVVDTSRLKTTFGYAPRYSTEAAFADFIAARGTQVVGPQILSHWEEQIYAAIRGSDSKSERYQKPYVVEGENR